MASGGSFINDRDGKTRCVGATADHPDGNCARDAKGKPLEDRARDQVTEKTPGVSNSSAVGGDK